MQFEYHSQEGERIELRGFTMQSSSNGTPQAETIQKWLQQEMGYQNAPSVESLRKICRGNMIPVWNFLIERVKSEKTNEAIRRNFVIHGTTTMAVPPEPEPEAPTTKERPKTPKSETKSTPGKPKRGRGALVKKPEVDKDSVAVSEGAGAEDSREAAMHDRDAAMGEVGRLRVSIERLVKDTRSRMNDVTKEEGERQRGLDDRSNFRYCCSFPNLFLHFFHELWISAPSKIRPRILFSSLFYKGCLSSFHYEQILHLLG